MPDFMTSQLTAVAEEKAYWDKAAQDPNVATEYIADVDADKCLAAITPHLKPGKVLEIGCGIGRLTSELAMSRGGFVYGIDISQKMLQLADKNTAWKTYTTYRQCDGRTIPFEDDFFESVYSMLVFQHIPDDAKIGYIKETYRVLKPGGTFRMQFVEGSHHSAMNHNTILANMVIWLNEAGFDVAEWESGLIYPEWTWITGVKE